MSFLVCNWGVLSAEATEVTIVLCARASLAAVWRRAQYYNRRAVTAMTDGIIQYVLENLGYFVLQVHVIFLPIKTFKDALFIIL